MVLVSVKLKYWQQRSLTFPMDDCDGTDYYLTHIMTPHAEQYERPLPAIVARLAEASSGCFMDIGANTGFYSLLAAHANDKLPIYAFEPVTDIFNVLCRNIEASGEKTRLVSPQNIALSAESGSVKFFETINDAGFISTSSSLSQTHAKAFGGLKETIVTALTLDEFVEQNVDEKSRVDFMKIDVEGMELHVLRGGERVVREHRPIILAEALPEADFVGWNTFIKDNNYCLITPGLVAPTVSNEMGREAPGNKYLVPCERIRDANEVLSGLW